MAPPKGRINNPEGINQWSKVDQLKRIREDTVKNIEASRPDYRKTDSVFTPEGLADLRKNTLKRNMYTIGTGLWGGLITGSQAGIVGGVIAGRHVDQYLNNAMQKQMLLPAHERAKKMLKLIDEEIEKSNKAIEQHKS